jgi:hypothetical protein
MERKEDVLCVSLCRYVGEKCPCCGACAEASDDSCKDYARQVKEAYLLYGKGGEGRTNGALGYRKPKRKGAAVALHAGV